MVPIVVPVCVSGPPPSARSRRRADPEVEHLDGTLARLEQIVGLDVAMKDATVVSGGEDIEDLLRDAERVVHGERAIDEQPLAQRPALEHLHDEEGRAVRRQVIVQDRDRPRVLDLVGDVAFAQEALDEGRLHRELRAEHLHGDASPVAVRRGIDLGHPADLEEPLDPPLRAEDGADALLREGARDATAHVGARLLGGR